jgi:HTH-type transcriptional regulator / antitoxin HigA
MTPGERLKAELQSKGWTQSDLAMILGRPIQVINEIISSKKAITPETAVQLGTAFQTGPDMWLQLEARYRLSLIETPTNDVAHRARLFSLAPVKDMERRGWIKKTVTAEELEAELCRFYAINTLDAEPDVAVSFRKTSKSESMNISQRAWCFHVKRMAQSVTVAPYSDTAFDKGIKKLRRLTGWPEETRKVARILAETGIRFVVAEPLPNTKIDGVAFWLDSSSPVIALSIRYDRIDSFWQTLGHELWHIKNRDDSVIDTDIVGESRPSPAEQDAIERRADIEAAAMWISQEEIESFILRVGPLYSRSRINQFANRLVIHPGIIVGQLQYRGEMGCQALRDTLVKVRDIVVAEALTDGWGRVTGI